VLLNILKHPLAALVVLVPAADAKEPPVVCYNSAAKLWNVRLEVHQIFALLEGNYVVEVNIFVAPFEVVNDSLVSELLFDNEDVLEELYNAFVDVEMVEFRDHGFLILEVFLIGVNERISFVNHRPDVLKDSDVHLLLRQRVAQSLVFAFLALQLIVHRLNSGIIAFKLSNDAFLVAALVEMLLDLLKVLLNFRQLF
jgi:hypothetical protein